MADHTNETIEISGCKTAVLRGGSGPIMLFLHGAGGAGAWSSYMDALAKRYNLIVPSHPGFGASDTPEWLDNMSDLAFFYLDLMEQLELTDVHVVGNSLGGWLAMEIAVRSTQRIKSLTLVSPAGIHVKGVPKGDIFLWDPETRVRNTFVNQKMADARLAVVPTEEEADIAMKNHFITAKLAWQPRFYNPDLRKWLHRIDVPTMILWGEGDRIFPVPYGEALKELIPGSELRVIADCGHLPHQEKTDEFIAGVNAITEGVAA